jgi:hypothetical protein
MPIVPGVTAQARCQCGSRRRSQLLQSGSDAPADQSGATLRRRQLNERVDFGRDLRPRLTRRLLDLA